MTLLSGRIFSLVALAIFVAFAAFAPPAAAGTVYRDRFIPGNVCMVDFQGKSLNTALIESVEQGTQRVLVGEFKMLGYVFFNRDTSTYRDANFLKVKMINGQRHEVELPQPDAEPAKQAFLQRIKETCHGLDDRKD